MGVLYDMRIFLLTLIISAALSVPAAAFAEGLIPCGGKGEVECQACHLVVVGDRIIDLLITVSAAIGAIMFAVAGLRMVTSAGNEGAITKAKESMTNVVIGFIILLAAWLIIDTIMKTFATGDSRFGTWNKIECVELPVYEDRSEDGPGGGGVKAQCEDTYDNDGDGYIDADDPECQAGKSLESGETAQCEDDAALMSAYNGSPVGVEAPGLRSMINCYLADSAVAAAVDNSQIYTFDRSHPRCSLTNGNQICGACSHGNNSCHYGGGSGEGAKAVDFNARAGFSEKQLYDRLQNVRSQCGGRFLFEGNHTHISLSSC